MSISAYVGLPRSGKSYSVVQNVIVPALKNGRVVYTNIPMNDDLLMNDFGCIPNYFTMDDIKNNSFFFDELPSGIIFIIDECWELWPAGLKPANFDLQHKEFLTKHGHKSANGFSTEIILVTQDLAQIATFVRNLVEVTYRTVKLTSVGVSTRYRVDIYEGCVTGPSPSKSKKMDSRQGKYKKNIYQYYTSQTQSDGLHGSEKSIDDRKNIFSGNYFIYLFLIVGVCSVFSFFGLQSVYASYSGSELDLETVSVDLVIDDVVEINKSNASRAKKPLYDVFAESKFVYISSNFGRYPSVEYTLTAEYDRTFSDLSMIDLHRFGYVVTPFNSCLIKVEVGRKEYFFRCQSKASSSASSVYESF